MTDVDAPLAPVRTPALERPCIFVCGNSRSGTSMMGAILGLHSHIYCTPEQHFFEHHTTQDDRSGPLPVARLRELALDMLFWNRYGPAGGGTREEFSREADVLVARLGNAPATATAFFAEWLAYRAEQEGKQIACEQTPRNVFYLDEILASYPEARVVVMVRDPRDVLASQKHKWKLRFKGMNKMPLKEALRLKVNYHPITTSLLWNSAIASGDRYAGHPRVFTLRFEDVLADADARIAELCAFLGLPYEPDMLHVPVVKSTFEEWKGEKRGVDPSAAGRWQRGALTPAEIYLCQKVCAAGMRRHGYDPAPAGPSPAAAWNVVTFPVKAGAAVVANTGRNRNMLEAVKRRVRRGR